MDKIKHYISPKNRALLNKIAKVVIVKPLRFISETYEKIYNHPPQKIPGALNGWSIITFNGGKRNASYERFVNTAYRELKGTPYEIIIIAPPGTDFSYFPADINIVHAPFRELHLWKVPFAISRIKNFGVRFAKYDKVVISHDYIYFLPGWKKGYDKFGDFTVAQNAVLNFDGSRHLDWIVKDFPGVGQALIPYDREFTEYQLMGGNYLVVKRDFFIENPMNNNLRWGEAEDYEWAFRVRKLVKFRCNPESKVQYSKPKAGINWWIEGTKKMEKLLNQKIL